MRAVSRSGDEFSSCGRAGVRFRVEALRILGGARGGTGGESEYGRG